MSISASFLLVILKLASGAVPLPTLNVNKSAISVSGISSGAAMATQFHVAFSSEVMGAGLIAGVPYLCAPAAVCMNTPSLVSVLTLQTQTASARAFLNIDSTFNMAQSRVWIFAGTKDTVVYPSSAENIRQFYSLYVDSPSQIKVVNDVPAAHGQPTNNFGGTCGDLQDNFINNCGYSAAYNLLNHIYGGHLQVPADSYIAPGDLYQFHQTDFTSFLSHMDTIGYLYVPTRCKTKTKACRLHIAFHGCQMGRERIGEDYVQHSGYNQVGELNDIIILYPQVVTSSMNPMGCWDWFAYTGIYYAFHSGPQMSAVHKMMSHLTG